MPVEELESILAGYACTFYSLFKYSAETDLVINCDTQAIPQLTFKNQADKPDAALQAFIKKTYFDKILFSAESPGRREFLYEVLQHHGIRPTLIEDWEDFRL